MNFTGFWKNEINNEIIEFSQYKTGDDYFLHYFINEEKITEDICLYLSGDTVLLPFSNKFGRQVIQIISLNSIRIDDIFYNRVQKNII